MARPYKFDIEKLNINVFNEYLDWISKQFDIQYDVIKSGERAGEQIEIKKPKIPSVTTFCHYIGTTKKTFYNWIDDDNNTIDEKLLHFITYVHEYLKEDRLSKGLNGTINAQLLSRVDGYNETVQIESNVQPIVNIALPGMTANFGTLQENNVQDVNFEEVKPIELTEFND